MNLIQISTVENGIWTVSWNYGDRFYISDGLDKSSDLGGDSYRPFLTSRRHAFRCALLYVINDTQYLTLPY